MTRASLQRRLFLGALAWIVVALVVTGLVLSLLLVAWLPQLKAVTMQHKLAGRLESELALI